MRINAGRIGAGVMLASLALLLAACSSGSTHSGTSTGTASTSSTSTTTTPTSSGPTASTGATGSTAGVPRGPTLTGFEVAGADGVFAAATARVDGNTIVASAPAVLHPQQVRYGWAANPACDLYNGAGLPASPFTTSAPDPGR